MASPAGHWICTSCRQAANRSIHQLTSGKKARPNARVHPIKNTTRHESVIKYTLSKETKERDTLAYGFRLGSNLPNYPARTRFAPSPTGYMHIGGLRTALYSYLLAKKTGGEFILRIEDTDMKRFVADAEQRLCDDLQWAGLQWDEGPQVGGPYGPYKQSERTHIYQEYAKQLLDSGAAYRCFCTPTNVAVGGQAYSTGGCHQNCSSLSAEQAEERAVDGKEVFTVRLALTNKRQVVPDLVYGGVRRLKRSPSGSASEDGEDGGLGLSDPVLVKGNGVPTYHFANVVDDHLMKITHVIRGSEWLPSLPLHYDLYEAFDWKPPLFAHVPLLTDKNREKLSKRSNIAFALDIPTLRGPQGILPEALRNYLALQGWSNPQKEDLMSLSELTNNFDLKFTRGNAIVDEEKLWYLQKGHVQRLCQLVNTERSLAPIEPLLEAIEKELLNFYSASEIFTRGLPLKIYIAEVLLIDSKHYLNPTQYVSRNRHFFRFDRAQIPTADTSSPPSAAAKQQKQQQPTPLLGTSTTPESFIKNVLLNFDFQQPYHSTKFCQTVPTASEESGGGPNEVIDSLAQRISSGISNSIWRTMLTSQSIKIDEDVLAFSSPYAQTPLDDKAIQTRFAGYVATKLGGEEKGITAEDVIKQYKTFNVQVMKFLRKELCYGLPGPSMGHVMAVLGWEEVCRRLEVEVGGGEGRGRGW